MNRKAFTLVELLVVISIIGMLVVLLLPAVQSARESGRRAQCENNLKQLSLGLLAYHSTNRILPAAMTMPLSENPNYTYKWGPNWVISILPHLEEQALLSNFNPLSFNISNPSFVPISDASNQVARSTQIKAMLCPSDVHNRTLYNPSSECANYGPNWARGNYGANGSVQQIASNGNGMLDADWTNNLWRGVMGCNTALSIDQVTDGTSCTVLLGELRSGLTPSDLRGTWAMGAIGASALWGDGVTDDQGPNNPTEWADDEADCGDLQGSVTLATLQIQRMGCWNGNGNDQATARSMHGGGVFLSFCDGSVHFINDYIDSNPGWSINTVNDLHVWERLMVSADGMPIDPSKY